MSPVMYQLHLELSLYFDPLEGLTIMPCLPDTLDEREYVRIVDRVHEATSTSTQYLILLIPLPHSAYDDTIKHESNKKERDKLPLAIS